MKKRYLSAVLCLILTLSSFAVPVYSDETGSLRGEGMVVAVLDSGFDIGANYFQLPADTNVKLTPASVSSLVKKTSVWENYPAEAKGTYISAKIPFAFSYVTENRAVASVNTHGNAVAAAIGAFTAQNLAAVTEKNEVTSSALVRPIGEVPRAQLLLMRISSGEYGADEAESEDVCAAISDSVILGADVIVINTTQSPGLASDKAFIAAVKKAENAGVAVFCGAGENGRIGTGSVYDYVYGVDDALSEYAALGNQSDFSIIPSLTTVASSEISWNEDNYFLLGNERELEDGEDIIEFINKSIIRYSDTNVEYGTSGGKSFSLYFDEINTVEYVPIKGVGTEEDFAALGKGALDGKIALIARGEIYFVEKIANAQKYGAAGVMIYESNPDELNAVAMDITGAEIPAVFLMYGDGQKLLEAEEKVIRFPEIDRVMTDMGKNSSSGATHALTIGPSFTVKGDAASISGTSFAAAKGAGIFAAVKGDLMKRYPSESAEEKRALAKLSLAVIASSAEIALDTDDGEISPRTQGSGKTEFALANAADAIMYDSKTLETQTNLGQNKKIFAHGGEFGRLNVTVENISARTVSYDLTVSVLTDAYAEYTRELLNETGDPLYDLIGMHADELYNLDIEKPLPPFLTGKSAMYSDGAVVSMGDKSSNLNKNSADASPRKITLAPGQKITLDLRIALSASSVKKLSEVFTNGFFVEGYVTLTPTSGDGAVISHPYMGFCGDWTKTPLAGETAYKDSSSYFTDNHLSANIGSDYGEGIVMLGQNLLIPVDGDAMINSESLNAINPFITYDDGVHPSGLCWRITPLRKITSHKVVIKSKSTGKIVHQATLGAIDKVYADSFGWMTPYVEQLWSCTAPDNAVYVYPDGAYTCEITLTSVFFDNEKATQKITFDFAIDTTPPEIVSFEVKEKDGEKFFEITAKDENYIQYILVHDGYDNYICIDEEKLKPKFANETERGKAVTLTFDASLFFEDLDEEYMAPAVYIEVVDYAYNAVVDKISRSSIES